MKKSSKTLAVMRERGPISRGNQKLKNRELRRRPRSTGESAIRELQSSKRKYRQFFENAHDFIMCMDLEGVIQYVNQSARELASPADLIGVPMSAVISVDQLERHEELLRRRKEGDITAYSFEWELVHPASGRRIVLDVRSSALIEDGKPSGVLTIGRDITDKKTRETNLLAEKEKYQMLVEGANDIIFEIDNQGVFLYCNPIGKEIWGYSAENIIGKNIIDFVNLADRNMFLTLFAENSIQKECQLVFRINTKLGEVRWVRLSLSPRIENGKFVGANGILIDINEKKRMYDELQLQEIQLRAVIESTGNGILALDNAGQIMMSNRRYADIWHIPPDLLKKKDAQSLRTFISGQVVDPDAFLDQIRNLSQSTKPSYDIILLKDGRILERYFYPLLSGDTLMGRVVSYRDVTDEKRMEQALRHNELLFKNVFVMSPVMMALHRLSDGLILEMNQAFTEYTGYQREEIIGRPIYELGIIDSATLTYLRSILSGRNQINGEEIQYRTKTGEWRYGLYSAILIDTDDQVKVLGLLVDITNRKQMEAQLKLREEESEVLAKNLEESNIALRVVLSQQEQARKDLEEKIQRNVNEIILPFISTLSSGRLKERDRHCLGLLESNLKSVLSPFLRNMFDACKNLTPKEILIAEMIRQGKNSKDIADMMSTSVATINTHRNNIRKKLNIKKQKTSLRSQLLLISK